MADRGRPVTITFCGHWTDLRWLWDWLRHELALRGRLCGRL
jgi:hypothetical protein